MHNDAYTAEGNGREAGADACASASATKDSGSSGALRDGRYSRQVRFARIGEAGQRKLSDACVLIVGVGALGASLAQHMVRAGVGEVRLADRDYVELSNLQRQTLFDEADAASAQPKAVAAADKLRRMNTEINIVGHVQEVNKHTLSPLIDGADLVLDGTDNAATRLLLSDECFRRGLPFVYGGVAGAAGMSASLVPGRTVCLRCMLGDETGSEEADTCDTLGVLSPAVEFVASLQAAEAIKWLTGNKGDMRTTWVSADLWTFRVRESRLPTGSPDCPYCGEGTERDGLDDEASSDYPTSVVLCGRNTVQVTLSKRQSLGEMKQSLVNRGCEVKANRYLVRAILPLASQEHLVLFEDGRVLVQGTSDKEWAVCLCQQYLNDLNDGNASKSLIEGGLHHEL